MTGSHLKVLLTGIAGFIGSTLSERLLESGYEIIGLDSFTPYYSKEQKLSNLQRSLRYKDCEFIEGDLLEVDLAVLLGRVDAVLHLAAQPGVRPSWSQFNVYVQNNILATKRLLDEAAKVGIQKFVFASSSSVYGDAESYPTIEGVSPKPVSPYGVTKDTCEKLCHVYHKTYSIPVAMLRFFTVYGPRQRPDMAFHNFIESMLAGKRITIYGDGNQMRDFTYVGDIVEGIVSALETDLEEEALNLGSGRPVRLMDVIKILQTQTASKSEIVYAEKQKGDATKTFADIRKAETLLDFHPDTGLNEGLAAQIAWHRERLRRPQG